MAHTYFIASVNDCSYMGYQCEGKKDWEKGRCNSCGSEKEKCATMGWKGVKTDQSGRFYLKMQEVAPYCDVRSGDTDH